MERVNSISQTISIIGITQLSGWLTLMLIDSMENKPHELTTTAMMRARYCELLGKRLGVPDTNTLFMVGLFSVLDALFDKPMEQVLSSLPISPEVSQALLQHEGIPGRILSAVVTAEGGDFQKLLELGLFSEIIRKIYLEAVAWTNDLIKNTEQALSAA
jgi:EAL and modified HD-GYP domain-containing signal transduction protein